MEDYEPEPVSRPAPKLSKTPSWIMLGFVLGALFVWWLPHEERPAGPPPPPPKVVRLERPKETEIEAVFAIWGKDAVWENDLTEVALWDPERKAYAINYEVLRSGDNYYFRSIPYLTRPILTHGVHADSPLQFTEPEAARLEWLRHVQFESLTGKPLPPNN